MAGNREKRTGSLRADAQAPRIGGVPPPFPNCAAFEKKRGGGAKRLRGMVLLLYPQPDRIPGTTQDARLLHAFQRNQGHVRQRLFAQHHLEAAD